jgi:hypothetical protein
VKVHLVSLPCQAITARLIDILQKKDLDVGGGKRLQGFRERACRGASKLGAVIA